jgi:hypothetical protein
MGTLATADSVETALRKDMASKKSSGTGDVVEGRCKVGVAMLARTGSAKGRRVSC